jgi:hypothetical protein
MSEWVPKGARAADACRPRRGFTDGPLSTAHGSVDTATPRLPQDEKVRIPHEAISQSLYRAGACRRELRRTGRSSRRALSPAAPATSARY